VSQCLRRPGVPNRGQLEIAQRLEGRDRRHTPVGGLLDQVIEPGWGFVGFGLGQKPPGGPDDRLAALFVPQYEEIAQVLVEAVGVRFPGKPPEYGGSGLRQAEREVGADVAPGDR
jgi:hypothetical protein